jgi:sporulation protein YlmC with PRC-barrel domain
MAEQAANVLNSACAIDLMRIESDAGHFLGHVFDLRCRWRPGDRQSPLDEIIFGRLGLLERIGVSEGRPDSVPWSAVKAVRDGVIVVADEAVPKRRKR